MTTAARQAEADQVELVYAYALTQVGADTIEDALALWEEIPPGESVQTAGRWLDRAINLILSRRERSRNIALSYYRLVRALRTGTTVADPRKPEPEYVSLEMLRAEFDLLVEDEIGPAPQPVQEPQTDTESDDQELDEPSPTPEVAEALEALADDEEEDEDDRILVEKLEELEKLIAQQEDDAEQEAEEILRELGARNLQKKLDKIDDTLPGAEYVELQEQARRDAGMRQAAEAERITLNAARGLVYKLGSTDKRVIGWVRYSETGTPCGFCAALMSRGIASMYRNAGKSSARSSKDADGFETDDQDRYHSNCHCVAVPIFVESQYDGPLFDQNRFYADLWDSEIKGKYRNDPKAAMSAWRLLLRQMAAAEQQETPAQAAA